MKDDKNGKETIEKVPNQKLNEIAAREEVLLLSLVLKHPDLMGDAAGSITAEHFQNEIPRRLYGMALSHHRRYSQLLTRPAMESVLSSEETPEKAAFLQNQYDSVFAEYIKDGEYGMLKDNVEARFVQRQAYATCQAFAERLLTATSNQDHIVAEFKERMAAIQVVAPGASNTDPYSCRSWGDIRNLVLPPAVNFWGELFGLGKLHAIFGQGGIGKSRVALNLVRNQVIGAEFAGMSTGTTPLRHLLMGTENCMRRLQYDIVRMTEYLNDGQAKLLDEHVFLATLEGINDTNVNLGDPANIAKWEATVFRYKPQVLWVDPWGDLVCHADQNDDSAMRQAISEIMRMARRNCPEAAVVVLAHARTGAKNIEQAIGYDSANFGKGSKALYSCARCVINMAPGDESEDPPIVIANAKNNDSKKEAPFAVRLDPCTHTYETVPDFNFEEWKADVGRRASGKGGRTAKQSSEEGLSRAIEVFTSSGALTKTQATEALRAAGYTRDNAADAIRQLLHGGQVMVWTPPGKNMPTYVGTKEAIDAKREVDCITPSGANGPSIISINERSAGTRLPVLEEAERQEEGQLTL